MFWYPPRHDIDGRFDGNLEFYFSMNFYAKKLTSWAREEKFKRDYQSHKSKIIDNAMAKRSLIKKSDYLCKIWYWIFFLNNVK